MLQQIIPVEQVYLGDRRLCDQIQHVRTCAAQARNADPPAHKLFVQRAGTDGRLDAVSS